MGAAQIIYLAFTGICLLAKALVNGEKVTGTHNFAVYFVEKMLVIALLFWGGFFGGG